VKAAPHPFRDVDLESLSLIASMISAEVSAGVEFGGTEICVLWRPGPRATRMVGWLRDRRDRHWHIHCGQGDKRLGVHSLIFRLLVANCRNYSRVEIASGRGRRGQVGSPVSYPVACAPASARAGRPSAGAANRALAHRGCRAPRPGGQALEQAPEVAVCCLTDRVGKAARRVSEAHHTAMRRSMMRDMAAWIMASPVSGRRS
jgi:hypothetical protein